MIPRLPQALFVGLVLALPHLTASGAPAQTTTRYLLDFGPASGATAGSSRAWNNLAATTGPTTLVTDAGAPAPIQIAYVGPGFVGTNSAGEKTPVPGSPLAQLNWPVSAFGDTAYGSSSRTPVTMELTGLDPNATYAFTIFASRGNVTDNRSTEYAATGFNQVTATLNPSNNASATCQLDGVLPDSNRRILLRVRADAANNNGSGWFYLSALQITETGGGSPPATLSFLPSRIQASRVVGRPAFATDALLLSNQPVSTVDLTAIDLSTHQPPTWLTHLGRTPVGRVRFDVSHAALPIGSYHAVVTARAAGFQPAQLTVDLTVRPDDGRKSILFYGNSYSMQNGSMPDLVEFLAEEAGLPAPRVVKRLSGGKNLHYHLTDPGQAAAISQSLPVGEEWDAVVLQGFSTEATSIGNPVAFRANAVAIVRNVRAHSPAAKAVLYQTWARGPGHSVYPGSFPTPLVMHEQIRTNYLRAADDINQAFGAGTARVARAGDCFWLRGFEAALYTSDLSHPTILGTAHAAQTVFAALYAERVCDHLPDFGSSGRLVTRLIGQGMGAGRWAEAAGLSDRVADPGLRRFPGSGADLLLRTAVGPMVTAADRTACPSHDVRVGDRVVVGVHSPNASEHGKMVWITLGAFATGAPPSPLPGWPQVHIPLATLVVVDQTPDLATRGLLFQAPPITASTVGVSVLLQGVAFGGNPILTTTDGHELRLR